MLQITDLTKQYPTGLRALHGVCLTVSEPQVIAIIGSSGAGKSTLIRCINRLVEPTSGSVKLDETEVTTLSRRNLRKARRRMGMIFQEYNLVERLTVMENVLSGRLGYVSFWQAFRRKYPPEDVQAAFELIERVGIARALMQKPELLLVDEPTASLDPKTSRQIMRLICELAHELGTPALVNIHDVALAQNTADRIIGLQDGHLVFDGGPADLSHDALTSIYGEEDWSTTIRDTDDDDDGKPVAAKKDGRNGAEREALTG